MGMVFCRGCGKEIHETALSCPQCGKPQVAPTPQRGGGTSASAITYYLEVLKKYAVFSGRARRKEYWYFFLFSIIASMLLAIVDEILGTESVLMTLYNLAVLIPSMAAGVRRLHDIDRSGWWLLLPIVNLVFLVQDSQHGANKYGSSPKFSIS